MAIANLKSLECVGLPTLFHAAESTLVAHKPTFVPCVMKSDGKPSHSKGRRGMTLIELLVVVAIILFAAAIFVPRLKPMMDHSKIREAARVVQLYLSTARNQAMSSGRSCGVMIEPLPSENGCSMTLTQVETPPLFGGDFANGAALTLAGKANGTSFPTAVGPNGQFAIVPIQFDNWPSIPLYPGDQIQLGYQGFWYIVAPTNSNGIAPGTSTALNKFNSSSVAQPTTLTTTAGQSVPCLFVYLDVSAWRTAYVPYSRRSRAIQNPPLADEIGHHRVAASRDYCYRLDRVRI